MTDSGILHGLKVLDLSWGISGPMTGMLLADHGAQVTRIEPPGGRPFRRAVGQPRCGCAASGAPPSTCATRRTATSSWRSLATPTSSSRASARASPRRSASTTRRCWPKTRAWCTARSPATARAGATAIGPRTTRSSRRARASMFESRGVARHDDRTALRHRGHARATKRRPAATSAPTATVRLFSGASLDQRRDVLQRVGRHQRRARRA